ncbi:MAG: AcrB/AcrD/AcrF family protein, partial [Pseudomonadota bacterium]
MVDTNSWQEIAGLQKTIQSHLDQTYPAAVSKVWKFVLGPGGGSLIEARFTGPDPVVLRNLSEQTKALFTQAGAISVKDDWQRQVQVLRPRINQANARRAELTQADITKAIAQR